MAMFSPLTAPSGHPPHPAWPVVAISPLHLLIILSDLPAFADRLASDCAFRRSDVPLRRLTLAAQALPRYGIPAPRVQHAPLVECDEPYYYISTTSQGVICYGGNGVTGAIPAINLLAHHIGRHWLSRILPTASLPPFFQPALVPRARACELAPLICFTLRLLK